MVAAAQSTPEIRLITSDVDGTLLNSKQELTAGVEHAVKMARSVGVPVSKAFRFLLVSRSLACTGSEIAILSRIHTQRPPFWFCAASGSYRKGARLCMDKERAPAARAPFPRCLHAGPAGLQCPG